MFIKIGKLMYIKVVLLILMLASSYSVSYAQLKKTAEVETLKSFTTGSVALLQRVLIEDVYYYCDPCRTTPNILSRLYFGLETKMRC